MDTTPVTSTETVHPNIAKQAIPQIEYSEAAKRHINFRRSRLIAAKEQRDQPRPEFDDMPFLRYMDILKKHDDQYIAPRKNVTDTSINTGTVRDKNTTLLEYAQKYDFEPVAQVFDEDDQTIEDMAEAGEDMVRKSLQLEDWRIKAKLVTRSLIGFGTALVEDQWVERWELVKEFAKDMTIGSLETTWTEKRKKTYDGCQAKLLDLKKCYFGDITKFFMNGPSGQPYFFYVEYISYDKAEELYGSWARWKYVPRTFTPSDEVANASTYGPYWTLRPVTTNMVEVIVYFDPIRNEYAHTLNGIDMLPILEEKKEVDGHSYTFVSGFPLVAVSPSGYIPVAKYDLEPMHEFAYSKSQSGKMRVLADVENMWFKVILRMMKQKAEPTMGNKSGKNFGPEITDPGTIVNDIRDGDLFPVLPNFQGPSQQDFSLYEMVKKELSKNSVEDSFQGINAGAEKTATQEMSEMRAQSLKVASLFDGLIWGNTQLYWLRTYNIIKNWTKPIDIQIDVTRKIIKDKYRSISVQTQVDGSQKATKKIIFTKDTPKGKPSLEDSEALHQKELDHKKENGGEMRETHINPDVLRSLRMNWYYSCVPVPNGSDPLSYMLFSKQIQDAANQFGPESLNVKKLKHKFAALTGNDYDTWFVSDQELEQKQQQQARIAAGSDTSGAEGGPTIAQTATGQAPSMAQVMR